MVVAKKWTEMEPKEANILSLITRISNFERVNYSQKSTTTHNQKTGRLFSKENLNDPNKSYS